jgi:hypothetical protein
LEFFKLKTLCKNVENQFFFNLFDPLIKNKHLKDQLANLKKESHASAQKLSSLEALLQQEEKNKQKLEQKRTFISF